MLEYLGVKYSYKRYEEADRKNGLRKISRLFKVAAPTCHFWWMGTLGLLTAWLLCVTLTESSKLCIQ